jgi:hypothetical protein
VKLSINVPETFICTGDLSTTRCNSNVLLLLHAIGSERYGRYAGVICKEYGFNVIVSAMSRRL